LAHPIAQVIPSILKVAVSGFTTATTSFFATLDSVATFTSVFLQLKNKILDTAIAKNDLGKFIIFNLDLFWVIT
jgi:hypothetical protein